MNAVHRFSGLGEIKVSFWEENKRVFNLQILIACPILIAESSEQQPYLPWTEGLKRNLWGRKVKSYQVASANTHLTQWCNTDLLHAFHHSLDLEQVQDANTLHIAFQTCFTTFFHHSIFFQGHMAAFLTAPWPPSLFLVCEHDGCWCKFMRFVLSGSQTNYFTLKN